MEGADHIFVGIKINAAEIGSCDKAAEIARNAAAQCDEKIFPVIVV